MTTKPKVSISNDKFATKSNVSSLAKLEVENCVLSKTPISRGSIDQSTDKEDEKKANINLVEKLPSIGPLNITNLHEFLVKSKTDFEYLYKDKTVWNYTISEFYIIKKLGSGAFGRVILAKFKKDDMLYAIKLVEKKLVIAKKHIRYVSNEKRILQSINFPFVVSSKFFFADFKYLYFVMPYVRGGDFYVYIHKYNPLGLSESDAKFYVGQLVLALEYLHYLQLIHRDVKPQNIMIDTFGYLKLADFGQCTRCFDNDKTWTITGTPEYMAPDIIKGKGYNRSVDWWALGVTTFEMCSGKRPFRHNDTAKLYKLILSFQFCFPKHFSRKLKKFISGLMFSSSKINNKYPDIATRVKAQSWLKNTDWLALLNRTIPAPYLPSVSDNFYDNSHKSA